jgi:hypothetical protein
MSEQHVEAAVAELEALVAARDPDLHRAWVLLERTLAAVRRSTEALSDSQERRLRAAALRFSSAPYAELRQCSMWTLASYLRDEGALVEILER